MFPAPDLHSNHPLNATDVLDQFTPATHGKQPQSPSGLVSPPPPPPTASIATNFGRPRTNTRVDAPPQSVPGGLGAGLDATTELDEDELSAEFSRELAKGMESLMREISGGSLPGEQQGAAGAGGAVDDKEAQQAFKAAWEAMLVEGMDGMGNNDLAGLEEFLGQGAKDAKGKESASEKSGAGTNEFQSKIQQAMNKLRESESNLQADSTPKPAVGAGSANPDSLEALLSSLGSLGLGEGEGPEDEAELAGLLENMMGQLMSKEVLQEPLKELADSFPPYLEKPPAPLSAEDRTRYENQLDCVRRILAVFDKPSYSDDNADDRKVVSDMMAEMQGYGSPPTEVMGPLPPGMGLGPDGLPQGEGCVIA
ncbi:Pex19 protein family-domain-containing protein [Lyophyllum atratum]|nr:Pex19 protein family-domain-containing protein [Lyophyllum atratum]